MPLPRQLLSAAITAIVLIAATGAAVAGPAGGLCAMNTKRGAVPTNFALEACVDSNAIVLRNQLSLPVHIAVSGSAGKPATVSSDGSTAALITRLRYPDPTILMPGDLVRIPLSGGAGSISVIDTDAGSFYALAATLTAFLPVGAGVEIYDAVATGIAEIVDANVTYQNCVAHADWLTQMGCDLRRTGSITWAVGKMVVTGLAKGVLSLLLDFAGWMSLMERQVPDVSLILRSERTLKQAALPAPEPAPAGPSCPGGSTFFDVYNRTMGPNNTMDYFRLVRGPKCADGWAVAYGMTGLNGSGQEIARCAWVLLRARGSAWALHDMLMQNTQPCDPQRPDDTPRTWPQKMCLPEVPATIRTFIGC